MSNTIKAGEGEDNPTSKLRGASLLRYQNKALLACKGERDALLKKGSVDAGTALNAITKKISIQVPFHADSPLHLNASEGYAVLAAMDLVAFLGIGELNLEAFQEDLIKGLMSQDLELAKARKETMREIYAKSRERLETESSSLLSALRGELSLYRTRYTEEATPLRAEKRKRRQKRHPRRSRSRRRIRTPTKIN